MNAPELLNLSVAVWIVAVVLGVIAMIALLVIVTVAAGRLGRSSVGWFIISFFLSPVVGGLMLILLELVPRGDVGSRHEKVMAAIEGNRKKLYELEKLIKDRIPPRID